MESEKNTPDTDALAKRRESIHAYTMAKSTTRNAVSNAGGGVCQLKE